MTSIFNPDNMQMLDWEMTLKSWQRTGFFPLWIFLPQSAGKVSAVLGPANLYIFLMLFASIFEKSNIKKTIQIIASLQVILLLTFCQARADYYACPLVLACAVFSRNSFYKINFLKFKLINYGNQIRVIF